MNIAAIRNNVDWTRTQQEMPRPEELAALVKQVPDAPRYLCASDYGETAEALRQKGYTWKEVRDWLAGHGADFTMQAIIAGWRTWCRTHAG